MTISILEALFIFGICYAVITWLLKKLDPDMPYISLLVVGGVLVTVGGYAIVDPQAALRILPFFVASGTPMIVGSMAEYISKRTAERRRQDATAREALRD